MLQDELHLLMLSLYEEHCTAVDLDGENDRARDLF
jgi:hypothetical protein